MRKILFLLAMALMSLGAQAQIVGYQGHVDEYDLLGRWIVTSFEGRLIQIDREFEYMDFSGNQLGRLYMKKGDDLFYSLWFISNSNKLHIKLDDGHVLNFVIMDYKRGEKDYLKLKSFDDACTIELKMDWPVNHISSIENSPTNRSTTYNLNGIAIESKDGVCIQNGKKYISKN